MQYLLHFLEISACCPKLLLYNSIRWTDEDKTLYNIIDFDIPEEQQVLTALTKAVLKADDEIQTPASEAKAYLGRPMEAGP